jgi:hypothetical protein
MPVPLRFDRRYSTTAACPFPEDPSLLDHPASRASSKVTNPRCVGVGFVASLPPSFCAILWTVSASAAAVFVAASAVQGQAVEVR